MGSLVAQVNTGKLTASLDSPELADFVGNLDPINAVAESSDGFVWRLTGDGNDATSLRPFADPDVIVNMSVWTNREALRAFTYTSAHTPFLRRRREWFVPPTAPIVALWHIPVGHEPTLGEARARLGHLEMYGADATAFTFLDDVPDLTFERTDLDEPTAQELITELNSDIAARYDAGAANFFWKLDAVDVEPGNGGFFVVTFDGKPAGCGAIRKLNDNEAELKRMYVRSTFRGKRLGAGLVTHLCGIARDLGISSVLLETGPAQREAIVVYERAGFLRIPPFGQYIGSPESLCYRLSLAP